MTQKQTGYMILAVCLGALLVSMSPEVKMLKTWSEATTPTFIAAVMFHLGSVIGAYIGGRITPVETK